MICSIRLDNDSFPGGATAVYLYGSFLRGRLRAESDLDVAVLPDRSLDGSARLILISRLEALFTSALRNEGRKNEVSVLDLSGKYVPVTLLYAVVTTGRLLYDKDPGARREFENAVKGEYFDFVLSARLVKVKKHGDIFQKA